MGRSCWWFLLFALLSPTSPAFASLWTVTVSGTVYADTTNAPLNQTGIFGTPGASLVGDAYTETITTDPLLNTYFTESIPWFQDNYGGPAYGGCCAAPYTLTVTVNGVEYTQTEQDPFRNRSYLYNGLTQGVGSEDQIYQEAYSSGCSSNYGLCTESYILASGSKNPFLPSVDFSQSLTVTSELLDLTSNTYFRFRDGPTAPGSVDQYTGFYGSIESISVNSVPEPGTVPLFATGLGLMALLARRRRQPINVEGQR
jgi:hypothetical protein